MVKSIFCGESGGFILAGDERLDSLDLNTLKHKIWIEECFKMMGS